MNAAQNAKWPRVGKKIVRLVTKDPELGSRKISNILSSNGHDISHVSVNAFLNRIGGETYDRRLNLLKSYSGPGRLIPEIRKEIVSKAISGQSISNLSLEYQVSRDTIYRWMADYKNGLDLKDKYVSGNMHPKAIYPKFEQNIKDLVAKDPSMTALQIAKMLNISSWTVWNYFKNNRLNKIQLRNAYAMSVRGTQVKQAEEPVYSDSIKNSLDQFVPNMLPAPPPKVNFISTLAIVTASSWFTIIISLAFIYSLKWALALIALTMGGVFFLYSLKYYLTLALVLSYSQGEKKYRVPNLFKWILGEKDSPFNIKSYDSDFSGLNANLDNINLIKKSYVSVHVALFNESHVVERLLRSITNFDYKDYEVILADDSTDKTTELIDSFLKSHLFRGEQLKSIKGDGWYMNWLEIRPGLVVKHIHRINRSGFKGQALNLALKLTNPKAEYISIFDADFVPYPDTLELFLKYFQESSDEKTAVVQGYQWHVLNKSENWITRGVRSEYAGSYVVERSGIEIYGGIKQISGSVYMIKRNVLENIGWGVSITEDFELTLKLYEKGYKVLYTPYVQAPAECVSTLSRLIRQRMRWAEGHSQNIKKMFWQIILSPKVSFSEKVELLFLTPYYLQAFFFLLGTIAWLVSETILRYQLPFWTEVWGWSLVITNMISLPLLNGVGLFLEEGDKKDFSGLGSFILLSYILVPFQAFAAVKGFIEDSEGPWFRTPKTGRITDVLKRGRFMRFVHDILPVNTDNPYLSLNTASNKFDSFRIIPKNLRNVGHLFTTFVLLLTITLSYFAPFINVYKPPQISASGFGVVGANNDNTNLDSLQILNVHSHPKKGDNWIVRFKTSGVGNLSIVPDDAKTDNDIRFVSLKCGDQIVFPSKHNGNQVEYVNWSCDGESSINNLIEMQGDHTLRIQFDKEMAFAYNGSPATSTSANATSYSFQRKTWYDGTRYWSAFYSGSDIDFFYSTNSGANWTQNSSASIAVSTYDFSIWGDSSNAFISYTNGFDVEARKASSYPGTGFTWGSATVVYDGSSSTDNYSYPTITADSNNKIWISSKRYEIVTVNEQIAANADDGMEDSNTTWSASGYLGGGEDFVGNLGVVLNSGFRFTTVNIPQGAVINSATISLYGVTYGGSTVLKIAADDEDDTVSWGASDRPSQITQTTATTAWNLAVTAAAWNTSPSITSVIQEIVDRAGWVSGNNIRIAVLDNGSASNYGGVRDYSNSTSNSAKLDVTYTSYGLSVRQSTNANDISAWGTATNLDSGTNSNKYGVIVPRTSGSVFAIWADGSAIESKNFNGTSWDTNPTSVATGVSGLTTTLSAVSDSSGNVHALYINSSNNTVYREFTSSWQTAVTLDSNTGNTYPTISIDTTANDLYAFWIRGNHIYYKKGVSTYASGNWDSSATDWVTSGTNTYATSNYSASGMPFVEWTTGTGSPYTVNWDILAIPEYTWVMFVLAPILPLVSKLRKRKKNL